MERKQRIVTTALWAVLVAVMMGVICKGLWGWVQTEAVDSRPLDSFYPVPPFALVDQDNRSTTEKELRGKVWVCDFIFTTCPGPCKAMSQQMRDLQKAVADPQVRFVSFSVDPERDTPAKLKEYAHYFGGDSRWILLTGTKRSMFQTTDGMHVTAIPADGEERIRHDTHFLLIDANGQMRGSFSGTDPAAMKQLAADIAKLTREAQEAGHAKGGPS